MKPLFLLFGLGLWAGTGSAAAHDWASWRGPEQTGVSRERNLPERFSPDSGAPDNNLIWKAPYGGRSTPLVMNGRVYLINAVGEGITQQERVMCLDADTGKLVGEYKFNVWHSDIVAVRLGWTNLCGDPETGNIYAHGTQGLFLCFDRDVKLLWSRSLTEEFGRISGYGGRVTSPVVDGDLVVVSMLNASWGEQARGGNRFLALDKRTGAVVWWSSTGGQPRDTYYSVPVVAVINGERLVISGGGDGGVHAFQVRTGVKVWSAFFGTAAVNCSPVVHGDRIYIGHGEENVDTNKAGRVVCLDGGQVKDGKPRIVWQRDGIKVRYVSPVLHEGRLYVCDDVAQMFCLDAETGKTLWRHKYGRNSKGSPVWADGKIYIAEVNAKFHILKPGSKGCEDLYTQFFRSPDGVSAVELNGSPAVANGRVYFMTSDEMYCIGKKDSSAATADPLLPQPIETATATDAPVHLQVLPADLDMKPGGQVTFQARLFDAHGRLLPGAKTVMWSVAPMLPPPSPPGGAAPPPGPPPPVLKGTVDSDGRLSVDQTPGQFGGVVAKVLGLTGRARVRVAPGLPYRQDFRKIPIGRSPGGWVNCQGKFAVVERDGSKVLKKLGSNPSPLVARANAYIGMPRLGGYTIQADVMGLRKGHDMADVGLVANRYTFMLQGNQQYLRLVSWEALPRIDKTVTWKWEPQAWYRMKLTVDVHGEQALVRGKIWPRGQPEPAAWTLEVEDPLANREGSPALYGWATGGIDNPPGAEAFFDNVSITPSDPHASKVGTR